MYTSGLSLYTLSLFLSNPRILCLWFWSIYVYLSCEVSTKGFSGDFLRLFPDYSIRVTKYTKVLKVGKQKSIYIFFSFIGQIPLLIHQPPPLPPWYSLKMVAIFFYPVIFFVITIIKQYCSPESTVFPWSHKTLRKKEKRTKTFYLLIFKIIARTRWPYSFLIHW